MCNIADRDSRELRKTENRASVESRDENTAVKSDRRGEIIFFVRDFSEKEREKKNFVAFASKFWKRNEKRKKEEKKNERTRATIFERILRRDTCRSIETVDDDLFVFFFELTTSTFCPFHSKER